MLVSLIVMGIKALALGAWGGDSTQAFGSLTWASSARPTFARVSSQGLVPLMHKIVYFGRRFGDGLVGGKIPLSL